MTPDAEAIALMVAQLHVRIEKRRQGAWKPDPGDTVQERRKHWLAVTEQYERKVEAGEYVGDEARGSGLRIRRQV